MTFVLVRWNDAEHPTTGEWVCKADVDKAPTLGVETCGYLVNRTPEFVQVAVAVACRGLADEQYTGIMTIPMGCVVSVVEVIEGKPAKPAPKRK